MYLIQRKTFNRDAIYLYRGYEFNILVENV